MTPFKIQVKNGRLVLDVPTDREDWDEFAFVLLDEVLVHSRHWLDDDARRALYKSVGREISEEGPPTISDPIPARIKNGRAWLDAPTDLPEGTIVELVSVDDLLAAGGDWMDDDERQQLHEELERSIEEVRTGKARLVDMDVFLARLRSRQ